MAEDGTLLSEAPVEPAAGGANCYAGRTRVAVTALALLGLGLCTATWAGHGAAELHGQAATLQAELAAPRRKWEVLGHRFCGVVNNPHLCPEMLGELRRVDPAGTANLLCKVVGFLGGNECELDMNLRAWVNRDPAKCTRNPRILFLWSVVDYMDADPTGGLDPDPLCGGSGLPGCPEWAAKAWMEYVDKWRPKLAVARSSGLHVTSPKFEGDVLGKMSRFFAACPDCSKVGSPYYIDVLTFFCQVDVNVMAASVQSIKGIASKLKASYANRPVMISSASTSAVVPAQDAEVMTTSGLFDRRGSPLDAVYWNAYPKAYSPRDGRNNLLDKVQSGPQAGKMLGQVFVEKCGPER